MSIKEAFDVVNANFNYITIEAIPIQVANAVSDAVANIASSFTGGNISSATRILSDADSTSSSTGALIVDGGVGIAGSVNVGETLFANELEVTASLTALNATITGDISSTNLSLTGLGSINSLTANTVSVSGLSTFSETRNNGNLEVIGESLLRSNVFITGTAGINAAARVSGNLVFATSSIDSINPNTGSLRVFGGAGIVGNVNIGGNLTVNGSITVGNSYVPAGPTSSGVAGQMSWDQNWFYICVGTDQWIRFAKDTGVW